MKWFRRNKTDFENLDWVEDGGRFSPNLCKSPPVRPEPWRLADTASECYILPVWLLSGCADPQEIKEKRLVDEKYIDGLRESINVEGLHQPLTVVVDSYGKIRLHDGYHRFIAISGLNNFDNVPVYVKKSKKVKGYGRDLSTQTLDVLNYISLSLKG